MVLLMLLQDYNLDCCLCFLEEFSFPLCVSLCPFIIAKGPVSVHEYWFDVLQKIDLNACSC